MKTKFYLFVMLILTSTFLVNCKKDEPIPITPAVKKYYISTIKKNATLVEKFTYNTDNKLIKWQPSDQSDSLYCDITYNSSGVLTDLTLYSNGVLFGTVSVEMNSSKNPVKAIRYTLSDTTTFAFEYNSSNYLTKLKYYHGSEILPANYYEYLTITCDAFGNVTREINYDISDVKSFQYDYQYDTKNSPLYYNEIKWPYYLMMQFLSSSVENISHFVSRYNMTKNTHTFPSGDVITTSYFYNTDGYPTKMYIGADIYTIDYIIK
jgi:hypothetical protein